MHNVSALVLTALIAWTMFLLILMEGLRVRFLVTRTVAANEFRPDNSNLPPFMQRLARAHANCIESFPIIGGLLVVALLTNRADVTDALAPLGCSLPGCFNLPFTLHQPAYSPRTHAFLRSQCKSQLPSIGYVSC
ncbi:MAG: MAPEG family protein [Thiobacillaceae bacterium]